MGQRVSPYDSVKAESFITTLEGRGCLFHGLQKLKDAAAHFPYFIGEVYNRRRLHSAFGR
jgi:hypothetical protein